MIALIIFLAVSFIVSLCLVFALSLRLKGAERAIDKLKSQPVAEAPATEEEAFKPTEQATKEVPSFRISCNEMPTLREKMNHIFDTTMQVLGGKSMYPFTVTATKALGREFFFTPPHKDYVVHAVVTGMRIGIHTTSRPSGCLHATDLILQTRNGLMFSQEWLKENGVILFKSQDEAFEHLRNQSKKGE